MDLSQIDMLGKRELPTAGWRKLFAQRLASELERLQKVSA
jgi:hypothetical protein